MVDWWGVVMRRTVLSELVGVRFPIVQAPIGLAAGARLASAVSNAGGLGTVAMTGRDLVDAREVIRRTRALTDRPYAANFILEFAHDEMIEVCVEEQVPVISVFWGDPAKVVARAHGGGALVLAQVGSVEEARRAADAGADVVVAQGFEAGGHVRGEMATMALTPAVVDAVAPTPVVAAGGIGDGRGLAAVLALGAAGAWVGTRFLLSEEAGIHPEYSARLQTAAGSDTAYTTLFDRGWPGAPHRVIRNSTVSAWEAVGCPGPGGRPGEDDVLATTRSGAEIRRYEPYTVSADFDGDIEGSSLWAGQCVGLAERAQPAAEIVREMMHQADSVLASITENPEG